MRALKLSYQLVLLSIAALFFVVLHAATQITAASGAFLTTWQTDAIDANDASITIPTNNVHMYDYSVDWGDGTITTSHNGDASHTYAAPGTYQIGITGTFPQLFFFQYEDAPKIQSVDAWGDIAWETMSQAFKGASNLTITATDAPDLSNVESLAEMFSGASVMNSSLNHWDVSTIINFTNMFTDAALFNQPLDAWNVSRGQSFISMFEGASSFNQDISGWDTDRAYSMNAMFRRATSFNQPIGDWFMEHNQDTRYMFAYASSFNQDLSSWNLLDMRRIDEMFYYATSFNQNLGNWALPTLTTARSVFDNSGMSTENYDTTIEGWVRSMSELRTYSTELYHCNAFAAVSEYVIGGGPVADLGFNTALCGPTDMLLTRVVSQLRGAIPEQTLLGSLTAIDVDTLDAHTFTLCETGHPDTAFFSIAGNMLSTAQALDFTTPLDANQDNTYDLCIRATDSDNNNVEKTYTVTLLEALPEEDTPTNNDSTATNDDQQSVQEGAVLGASTDGDTTAKNSEDAANQSTDEGAVLGDSDTLADTGIALIFASIAGSSLMVLALSTRLRTATIYRKIQ